MFKNLLHFSHHRTRKEAAIFYGSYLLISAILGLILGFLFLSNIDQRVNEENRILMNFFINPLFCALLAALVVLKRNHSRQYKLLIVICSAVLGYYGGTLLGLLPISYATTRN